MIVGAGQQLPLRHPNNSLRVVCPALLCIVIKLALPAAAASSSPRRKHGRMWEKGTKFNYRLTQEWGERKILISFSAHEVGEVGRRTNWNNVHLTGRALAHRSLLLQRRHVRHVMFALSFLQQKRAASGVMYCVSKGAAVERFFDLFRPHSRSLRNIKRKKERRSSPQSTKVEKLIVTGTRESRACPQSVAFFRSKSVGSQKLSDSYLEKWIRLHLGKLRLEGKLTFVAPTKHQQREMRKKSKRQSSSEA